MEGGREGNSAMKLKTEKAAAKRFRLTGTGKIKRRRAYASHILTKKSSKRKRRLAQWTPVSPADMRRVKGMLNL
jgi:large subunit ribosomal protein L35